MPIAPPDTHRIKDLDQLNDPAKLLDTILEAESATGVDKNYKVTFPTVIQTVANNLPGTNRIKSAYKAVRTYDTLSTGYQVGFDTLVGLDSNTLCVGTLARVELPAPSRDYVLIFDSNSSLYVYPDGSFVGQKVPARWVEKNSYDNLTAAIQDFNPFQGQYDVNNNVKYTISGALRIFSAKLNLVKSSFGNNQIPAPTGLITDPNWSEISPESAPNFSRLGQLVCRFYSNAERAADPYPFGDTVEELIARENAGASILYDNRLVTVALGPQAGTYRVTYNPTNPDFYGWVDGSFVGGRNPCSFEKLNTAATTAVMNWIAGPQTANSLVLYNGNVYRVKQDIANGQAAPDTNTQYYQLLNADVTRAYMDAADMALQAQITAEKNRMDILVTGAPQALDTLKEIADQIAADEVGVAAILATQQQHTQALPLKANLNGGNSFDGSQSINNGYIYADGSRLRNISSDIVTEGNTNKYYSDSKVQTYIDASYKSYFSPVYNNSPLNIVQAANSPATFLSSYYLGEFGTFSITLPTQAVGNAFTSSGGAIEFRNVTSGNAILNFTNGVTVRHTVASTAAVSSLTLPPGECITLWRDSVFSGQTNTDYYLVRRFNLFTSANGGGTGGGTGGGSTIYQLAAITIAAAGTQTITLPKSATAVINLTVLEATGYVRTIWLDSYSVVGTTLTITTNANLKAGDKVAGSYY
jgi:hypothetical protein